ncbi:proteasome subunit beta [Natronoglycomyces albus]|uniref:Proteasome subunit beta n=1 Tax=Natronoglycomyces albus TaxID=2811108 RepID=A0A895XNS2_9ACTN|nr:proteasome subunit beta [Natronoglycomyces albus]
MTAGTSSFTDFLSQVAPDLLPGRRPLPPGDYSDSTAHATTIVALRCADGVVMAGDRRATQGNYIANRDMEKVFAADAYSVVGIAGAAGMGLELVKLFQLELQHYEKIEGQSMSLNGKANRLATMLRGNLAAAMQGLAVLPLFAGFDTSAASPQEAGRIFSFDVVGGLYEERDYDAIGSGSLFAKGALKKRYSPGLDTDATVRLAVEALYDAADDDSATGGPDLTRKIFPVVYTATAEGANRIDPDEVAEVSRAVVEARHENPGG